MVTAFIYAEDGASIQNQCRGASSNGGCPRSHLGTVVVCAGRKIVLAATGEIPEFLLFVEPDARVCPLAVLNLCGDDLPAVTSPGRAAAALRWVADDQPAITSPTGAADILRGVRRRGERAAACLVERAAACLVGWRRAVREALSMAGRTIQPQEGGDS